MMNSGARDYSDGSDYFPQTISMIKIIGRIITNHSDDQDFLHSHPFFGLPFQVVVVIVVVVVSSSSSSK